MNRGPYLIRNAACEQQAKTRKGLRAAELHTGDARVRRERGFHVEAHPIKPWQHVRESLRHHSCGVQANAKAEIADGLHSVG